MHETCTPGCDVSIHVIMNYHPGLRDEACQNFPDLSSAFSAETETELFVRAAKNQDKVIGACLTIGADEYATAFARMCYNHAVKSGSKLKPELFVYCAMMADPMLAGNLDLAEQKLSQPLGKGTSLLGVVEKILHGLPEISRLHGIFQKQVHSIYS